MNGNLGNQVEDGDDEYEQNELLPTVIYLVIVVIVCLVAYAYTLNGTPN